MTKARIVNCKEAGIRKCPNDDQIIGKLKVGDTISVNTSKRYFSWTDKEYYKCESEAGEGYILAELISTKGGKT